MGKNKSRKRARLDPLVESLPSNRDDELVMEGLNLFPDELDTTVTTLELLTRHPEALKSKEFKALRTSVYDLHRIHSLSNGVGSFALRQGSG